MKNRERQQDTECRDHNGLHKQNEQRDLGHGTVFERHAGRERLLLRKEIDDRAPANP